MMILCFAAHKGGVGKTTSSISLAAALARAGASTLLVDLDPQGHSSIGLGCDLEYDDPSVADILSDRPLPLASLARPTEIENLTIVPSNLRLAAAAETLHPKFKREERLAKYLAHLSSAYGWIVIDCPPALGVLTANAVMAADIIEFIPLSFWYDAPLTSQDCDRRHDPWLVYGSPTYSPARWSSWISPA
jgi:chromosome partitioning protein